MVSICGHELTDKEVYLILNRHQGISNLDREDKAVKSLREKNFIDNETYYNFTPDVIPEVDVFWEEISLITLRELSKNQDFFDAARSIEKVTGLPFICLLPILFHLESVGKLVREPNRIAFKLRNISD